MKRTTLLVALSLGLAAGSAAAWEAATTHAGLAEQAAVSSELHERLRSQLGIERGLFAQLTVPPADAEPLFVWLRKLDPSQGYVPDARGRMNALGWLAAGAVVADSPVAFAANHFFDPISGKGLDDHTVRGMAPELRHRIRSRLRGESINRSGMPAVDWVVHPDNPMNLDGFLDQYAKSVRAGTLAERQRHLAGALLGAGALLHVLQDMGSPSHVRNDLAAHLMPLGDAGEVGSRFERVAALGYGRLGVPAPNTEVTAPDLRSFFTTEDGGLADRTKQNGGEADRAPQHGGLADRTALRYFSAGTLPRPIEVRVDTDRETLARKLAGSLRRAHPTPLPSIDLRRAATSRDGVPLLDDRGVCLARYRLEDAELRWSMDDECLLAQAAAILPEVAAYSTGLLDWLFRGTLRVDRRADGYAVVPGLVLGQGSIEVFWDDSRGVRTALGAASAVTSGIDGQPLVQVPAAPAGATRISVLYTGVDGNGEPVVATGTLAL